jgi:hypothetical protein
LNYVEKGAAVQTQDLLMYLGISPPMMLAGFLGAVSNVFYANKSKPREVTGTVFIGTVVANYFGYVLKTYSNDIVGLGGAFLLGFGGIALLIYVLERRFPSKVFRQGETHEP